MHGCLLAVPSAHVGSSPSAQVQRPPRLLFVIEYFDIEKEMLFSDPIYIPYLRPLLPLPRLVEAGVVVDPEPGSDPSAQVLSWIEVQNNISDAQILERQNNQY